MSRPNALMLALAALSCIGRPQPAVAAGASFLGIGVGARAAGLGNAYTALADDASAIYWNPAGLGGLPKRELSVMHSEWLMDTKFDFLGYAHPLSWGTVGVGVTRLSAGSFAGRSADRQETGGFSAADTSYTLSVGRVISPGFGLGINLKYLTSSIGSDSASTYAVDLGGVRRLGQSPVSLGASIRNLGPGLRYLDRSEALPLAVAGGAVCRLRGPLNIAAEVQQEVAERRTTASIGTEYAFVPSFSLRGGYAAHTAQTTGDSALNGFSGGFGLKIRTYTADYAVTPFGALGEAHRISFGARF